MYQNMFAADKLQTTNQKSCRTIKEPCWIPHVSNFIPKNDTQLNTCSKVEDYDCMLKIFQMIRLSVSAKCVKHCEKSMYKVSKSQTPIPESTIVRYRRINCVCTLLMQHAFSLSLSNND